MHESEWLGWEMGESKIENGNLAKFAAEEIWQMTSKGS